MTTLKKPVISHRPAMRSPVTQAPGVSSDLLLGGRSELKIRHNGETYSLRKTRLGKLILTK